MQIFPIQKRFVQGPDFIELKPSLLEEQLAFAKANNVDGFIIGHDWKDPVYPDLSFLPTDIRGLLMTFEAAQDISLINTFHKLEVLNNGWSSYPHAEIDLAQFPNMRVCDINWNKNYKSLGRLANVIRLNMWKYKPKLRNLEEIRNCDKIVYVALVQPGVDNLDGIENMKCLKDLELANVRSLKQFFSSPKEVTAPLERLYFSICPHFDLDTIPPIGSLKRLGLNKIGKRETLKNLLLKFPNLESLSLTESELTDGNLDYILEHPTLRRVTIDHKKHYNLKEKEIEKRLSEKHQINLQ